MKIEHLITVKTRGKGKKRKPRWPVDPSDRSKLLIRRRPGGIRFWDVGYVWDGAKYITLPYTDPNSGNSISNDGVVVPGWVNFDALTTAHYDPLHESILDYPTDTWKAVFHQIDDTYFTYETPNVIYRGTLYSLSDPDVWNGDRFLPNGPTPDDSFSVGADQRFFYGFDLGINTKITNDPTYGSSPVAFVPSKNMDVFLAPNLNKAGLEVTHTYIMPIADFTNDALDYLRVIHPREVIFDDSLPIYQYDLEGIAFTYSTSGGTLAEYEAVYNFTQYWKENYGYRALRGVRDTFLGDTITDLDPALYAVGATFPAPPSTPPSTATMSAQLLTESALNGNLIAVILKGGIYYYVWAD